MRRATVIVGALVAVLVFVAVVARGPVGVAGSESEASPVALLEQLTGASAGEETTNSSPDEQSEDPAASVADGTSDSAVAQSARYGDAPCVAGQVLVSLAEGAQPVDLLSTLEDLTGLQGFSANMLGDGSYSVSLPEGLSIDEALAWLESAGLVDHAQPNFVYYTQTDDASAQGDETPEATDELATQAYNLVAATMADNSTDKLTVNDPLASEQWAIEAMNLAAAWKIAKDAGAVSDKPKGINRTVAVIDEGFDVEHEDLAGLVVDIYDSYNETTDDVSPLQTDSHGTHVAGIVGAQANNGVGVAGVSYNAQLQLIRASYKSSGRVYFTSSSLAGGIAHVISTAKTYNTHVISISVGVKVSSTSQFDKVLTNAIDSALANDIVVVCSAGNKSTMGDPYINYPSDYAPAVSVMNVQNSSLGSDEYSRYATSNYNMSDSDWGKDISAPGTSITSAINTSEKYGTLSGTSMAAPHVTGVLSLMFAVNPNLSASRAIELLYATATDLRSSANRSGSTFDDETGYGLVNAQAAVAAALAEKSDDPVEPDDPDDPEDDPVDPTPVELTVKRLQGSTALDTMWAIVKAGGAQTGGTVVLATAEGYWDALSASGVAGLADAPVVMTSSTALSPQAKTALATLKPKRIIVIGGTDALSSKVYVAAYSAAGTSPSMARLSGATADATAVSVYARGTSVAGGNWSSTAFVCTDSGYWDALSAAPISYAKGMPIFLTRDNGASLSTETLNALKSGGFTGVYIIGGSDAVSANVPAQLSKAGIGTVVRVAGSDAIATSTKVAQLGIDLGLQADGMGLATSKGYWDALAGAAFCGKNESVLLVADGPKSATITAFAARYAGKVSRAYVFGGTEAVSAQTEAALRAALL